MKLCLKNLFKILCVMLFAAITALVFVAFYRNINAVKAEETNYSAFLPFKSEEYYALNSPIHAYSDIDITAITESTVLHLLRGNAVYTKSGRSSLNQVKRVNGDLYFNDYSKIYRLPLSNLTAEPQFISLTGTYFDINEKYIITIYESIIEIYKTSNLSTTYKTISHVQNKPVALNSQNLFYVSGNNNIIRRSLSEDNFNVAYTYENTNAFSLSFMIADENFVYYLSENKIYRLEIADVKAVPTELTFNACNFDLGKILAPKGLSLKNGNLLITDYAGSVQEFKIDGDKLEFTGYAVASGLSAFNRVGLSAKNIERYGNNVAVLDGKKLTVIDTENIENYNKDGFINLFVDNAPARFALGNGTILYSKGTAITVQSLSDGNVKSVEHDFTFSPVDISYQSGNYYVAYTDGTDSDVAVIDEATGEIVDTVKFSDSSAKIIAGITAADVFNNVYVADNSTIYQHGADGKIKKYSYSGTFTGAKKLCSDLAGNLFVLSSNGKIYLLEEKSGGAYSFKLAYETSLGKIKTFGLNFDKKETYFLIDGKEEIYFTTKLNNASLADFIPSTEFKRATEKKAELKVYTANLGANVYSVKATDTEFIFNGLIGVQEEYPLIAEFRASANLTLFALSSDKGVVFINEKELSEKTVEFTDAPEKAFITTTVSAYAIPVIDRSGTFAINKESAEIRLNKGTEIAAKKSFTILGKTWFDAEITIDGEMTECYIPADFTTETLIEDLNYDKYEIETVKSTAVYKNEDLTDEFFKLNDGDTVKVLARKNGILKILTGDMIGYISEKSVKTNPNATVRNVLIILAVVGSLAGTLSYFLLRKKK